MQSGYYNLLIIIDPTLLDPKDFSEIGELIKAKNNKIFVYILSGHFPVDQVATINWHLPTFSIGINGQGHCIPKRGPYFFNHAINKFQQIEAMKRSKIRVPNSKVYVATDIYSESDWGDYVIVKSGRIAGSSDGETAHLTPTRYLSAPEKLDEPVRSLLRNSDTIIQEFIPTGKNPTAHRIPTLLGRPLYHFKTQSTWVLPQLDPLIPKTHIFDSNREDDDDKIARVCSLISDPQALALAQKIAKEFANVPLLGIDLVKSERTGDYYALEVNAGGNTWHFSSPMESDNRNQVSREERINQFGAWTISAQVLIEKTLYYAR